jgi:hypothetical protein
MVSRIVKRNLQLKNLIIRVPDFGSNSKSVGTFLI